MRPFLTACCVLALGLAGCFGGSPQPRYYALEPEAPARAPGGAYPFTLLVRRFETALAYDRSEIVYRPSEHELRFYEYRLWIAKPGRMLSEVIATHLDALGLFQAVTTRSTERPAHYELRGEVLAIDEIDRMGKTGVAGEREQATQQWKARLAMKLALSSLDSGEVVWAHAFETVRDVDRHDPHAVIEVLAAILDDELARMTAELDRTFARITGTPPRLEPAVTATPAAPDPP